MSKEDYQFYKSRGFCVDCRHEKAEPGYVRCLDCLEKRRNYIRKKSSIETKEWKEKQLFYCRKSRQKLYDTRRAKGLCYVCGGERLNKRFALCEKCREKCRNKAREKAKKIKEEHIDREGV